MIDTEIQIIRETWRDVSNRPGTEIGMLFYDRLFENVPHLPHFFQNDLRGQSKKFIVMLDYIINKLDDANFIHHARTMGRRYLDHGIREEHFEQIKQALFWALKTKLKERWTPTVMVSWGWYFSMLSCIMREQNWTRN